MLSLQLSLLQLHLLDFAFKLLFLLCKGFNLLKRLLLIINELFIVEFLLLEIGLELVLQRFLIELQLVVSLLQILDFPDLFFVYALHLVDGFLSDVQGLLVLFLDLFKLSNFVSVVQNILLELLLHSNMLLFKLILSSSHVLDHAFTFCQLPLQLLYISTLH